MYYTIWDEYTDPGPPLQEGIIMALAIMGVVAAIICSVGALLLGVPWWAIPLIYMGAGSVTLLGCAIWVYLRTPDLPKQRDCPDDRQTPTAAVQITPMRVVPIQDIAGS
ncbi:hypothetical protein [Paracoccus alcaliphilus]|nr:hypothetical protein [Paracoccus alcaliphilus]WCR18063.1 hypothetical protein JHW40_17525 [Paracoccus alcaliphilus]